MGACRVCGLFGAGILTEVVDYKYTIRVATDMIHVGDGMIEVAIPISNYKRVNYEMRVAAVTSAR